MATSPWIASHEEGRLAEVKQTDLIQQAGLQVRRLLRRCIGGLSRAVASAVSKPRAGRLSS
jgi:hypothetical protein